MPTREDNGGGSDEELVRALLVPLPERDAEVLRLGA